MRRAVLAMAVVGLLSMAAAAPALAQTSTTGYVPAGCSGNTNLGSTAPGGTIAGTIGPNCPFTGTVNMSVNGGAAGTKSPNSSGGVTVSVQVVSTTSGLLNDPVAVTLQPGTNTITATGITTSGASATVTGTFTVTTSAATTATTAAVPASRVAFTGANILRWSLAALALIGIGALFVLSSRRRRFSD